MSKMNLKYCRVLVVMTILILTSFAGFAVNYTSNVATGDWNTASTWSPNTGSPSSGDGVVIAAGHVVTHTGNLTWSSNQISITGKLIVNGNLLLNGSANLYLQTGSELVLNGDFVVANNSFSVATNSKLTVSGKTEIQNGDFSISSSATVDIGGFLYVKNNLNLNASLVVGQYLTVDNTLNNNSGSFLQVAGNTTVQNSFNNNANVDLNGNLTLTSGDLNVNSGILAIEGNLNKSGNIGGTGNLIVGGNFNSMGGNTNLPQNGGNFYVFGSISATTPQSSCDNSCFPNDGCAPCLIQSGPQWIDDASPGNPYISYYGGWVDHLANKGKEAGPIIVCPSATSNFSVLAVDDGNLAANIFEWAVYGGIITSADNTSTVSGHSASVKTITGGVLDGKSSISVTWEATTFAGAYVAVRQTSAVGCSDGLWSVFYINIQEVVAPSGSATQSFCAALNPTVANLSATGTSIQWYSTPSGGTALDTGTPLVAGNYYASQTIGGCESTSRFAVTATLRPAPTVTFSVSATTACVGSAQPTVTFTNPQNAIVTVTFNVVGVGDMPINIPANGTNTVSVPTNAAASYTGNNIRVAYTDAPNCQNTIAGSITITIQSISSTPVVSGPLCPGSISVSGTSTEANGTTIEVFVNSTSAGTTTVTGGNWTKAVSALAQGNSVSARATASGKCTSALSSSVLATDTSAPVFINCPSDITVDVETAMCTKVVSWTIPTVTDNCGIPTLTFSASASETISTPSSGTHQATIALGSTTITYTATDNSENVETCSFTITVTDNIAPTISCPAGATVFCAANAPVYGTYIEFTTAGGSASDNCSLNTDSFIQLPDVLSGSTLTRTYQIADAAGNINTCTQVFTISQPAVTIISLGLNNTCIGGALTITSNSTGLNYQWQVSSDNGSSWATTGTNSASYNGTLANQGDQYRLLVSETTDFNVGCVATSNTLTFRENIPPVFTALKPTDMTVCIINGAASGAVYDISLDNSKVTDVCTAFSDLSIAYNITGETILSGNTNLPDGTVFDLGVSTVEYTVTDLSGNSETHSFTVTVSEAPILTDISTDGIPATDGSGYKPYQSSTHTYTVDGGIAAAGYTYTWTVLDNANSVLSPGLANTYTIDATNPAVVLISWGASIPLAANNYKVRVRKTSNTNTCLIEKELSVTVLENLFNATVVEQGDQCQSGEAGTTTIVEWIINKTGGANNWRFDYEISDGVGAVASGLEVPVSGNTKSIFFNVTNQAGVDKTYTFTITNVFDVFNTPETDLDDNEDTVTLWGVPNTSAISTD